MDVMSLNAMSYASEAEDTDGCGFAHSFRLRDTKRLIDESIENAEKK